MKSEKHFSWDVHMNYVIIYVLQGMSLFLQCNTDELFDKLWITWQDCNWALRDCLASLDIYHGILVISDAIEVEKTIAF